MTKEQKQIYTLRISEANKTELVVILYDMLLDYVKEAEDAMDLQNSDTDNRNEIKEAVRKARGCLKELMNSLDLQYEISGNLLSLYVYANRQLVMAEIRKDKDSLSNVTTVIKPLRDAYAKVAEEDDSEAIMMNTQKVVAGLTYSKNEINEAMDDQANRGFYV